MIVCAFATAFGSCLEFVACVYVLGEQLPCRSMLAIAAAVFSVLLILTGAVKIVRPHDVQRALVTLGMPRMPGIGIAIGVVELAIGIGALLIPFFLVAQATLYSLFAVWVAVALRSSVPIASCGCLGRADTPPTAAHIVLNVVAAVISVGAIFGDPLASESGLAAVASIVVIATGLFLSYIILTDAAHLEGVRRT